MGWGMANVDFFAGFVMGRLYAICRRNSTAGTAFLPENHRNQFS
jgi:hypothetical protein